MIPLKTITRVMTLILLLLLSSFIQAQANEKIIYVPLDDRPVCLDYVQQSLNASGYELVTPPAKLLANGNGSGRSEALWRWLSQNARNASIAVISTDGLVYGGLVASRVHERSLYELAEMVSNFQKLKEEHPGLKLYAFSTIMRTPRQSFGKVEPPYYNHYGSSIFALTQLFDKEDGYGLTPDEAKQKKKLLKDIPKNHLDDWFDRRRKNFQVNRRLIDLLRKKTFHYLLIGKDDDAPLSQTNLEGRKLIEDTIDLSAQRFKILSGVDQLGLLLLTRSVNELRKTNPSVYAFYSEGAGKNTLPLYSDQRLSSSVPDQIQAIGGNATELLEEAALVLAINTPYDGLTKDATAADNLDFASPANKRFITRMEEFLDGGKSVAIADVAYSNGADNGFLTEIAKRGLLSLPSAYSGWNTADNSIGFALAQGVLAKHMREEDRLLLLKTRYLDDWIYQSNVRPMLTKALKKHSESLVYDFSGKQEEVENTARYFFSYHSKKNSFLHDSTYLVTFPWNRLFEVKIALTR